MRINVGGKDLRSFEQTGLVQQNGGGIDLLPGGAARMPYPDERAAGQRRNNLFAQHSKELMVPEHFGNVHRDAVDKMIDVLLVGPELVPELIEARVLLQPIQAIDAPAERFTRIVRKIVSMQVEQVFEDDVYFLFG
jgi:hypothetical protein